MIPQETNKQTKFQVGSTRILPNLIVFSISIIIYAAQQKYYSEKKILWAATSTLVKRVMFTLIFLNGKDGEHLANRNSEMKHVQYSTKAERHNTKGETIQAMWQIRNCMRQKAKVSLLSAGEISDRAPGSIPVTSIAHSRCTLHLNPLASAEN